LNTKIYSLVVSLTHFPPPGPWFAPENFTSFPLLQFVQLPPWSFIRSSFYFSPFFFFLFVRPRLPPLWHVPSFAFWRVPASLECIQPLFLRYLTGWPFEPLLPAFSKGHMFSLFFLFPPTRPGLPGDSPVENLFVEPLLSNGESSVFPTFPPRRPDPHISRGPHFLFDLTSPPKKTVHNVISLFHLPPWFPPRGPPLLGVGLLVFWPPPCSFCPPLHFKGFFSTSSKFRVVTPPPSVMILFPFARQCLVPPIVFQC